MLSVWAKVLYLNHESRLPERSGLIDTNGIGEGGSPVVACYRFSCVLSVS